MKQGRMINDRAIKLRRILNQNAGNENNPKERAEEIRPGAPSQRDVGDEIDEDPNVPIGQRHWKNPEG